MNSLIQKNCQQVLLYPSSRIQTFGLFSFLQTKITGAKLPLDWSQTWIHQKEEVPAQIKEDHSPVCFYENFFWRVPTFKPITGSNGKLSSALVLGKKRKKRKVQQNSNSSRDLYLEMVLLTVMP